VVLAFGHALRAHEALSGSDALPGFLEVVHRLLEDGVFVGHYQNIRLGGILRRSPSPSDCSGPLQLRGRPPAVCLARF
jgi:hypothetical protein